MPKRRTLVPRHLAIHHQAITPATRFQRLPVWVSRADIVAYFKVSKVDAQALIDSASRRCLIDGAEKISKYQLQAPLYRELIPLMRRHPSRPSIRRLFRAAIEKNSGRSVPSPAQRGPKRVCAISAGWCAMSARRTVNGPLLDVKSADEFLGGSERWVQRHLN